MHRWGPYLAERAWGISKDACDDATYEEACASGKFLDGIFGLSNNYGTVKTSFAFWNGKDSHLRERLFDQNEQYIHGMADPEYRYCSCRYVYPQTEFPYDNQKSTEAFDLHFELATIPDQPPRLFYRLTVTNRQTTIGQIAELVVAAQIWVCHPGCGTVSKLHGISDCLSVGETVDGNGFFCRRAQSVNFQQNLPPTPRVYRLHYQPDGLESVAFSNGAAPDAFDRLIVHGDASRLQADSNGYRAALVYRLKVPARASVCLSFLVTDEVASSEQPSNAESISWSAVDDLMKRAAQIATDSLIAAAAAPDQSLISDDTVKRICRRAWSNILWNWQLCHVETPQMSNFQCLAVVPDKWHMPRVSTWEHALHVIVLCRISRELATVELRSQLSRMLISGEIAGAKAALPVWPLAVLELLELYNNKEDADLAFKDLLCHLNWWIIERKDSNGRHTLHGGILSLEQRGWTAFEHSNIANDSIVWSGFFCAKMIQLAVHLERQELKILLDMFNAVLTTMRYEVTFVGGLFRPRLSSDKQESESSPDAAAPSVICSCAFGLAPLLGCACIPSDRVVDGESKALIEWLNWLSNEITTSEAPSLFIKTNASNCQCLVSWINETEFVRICATLFDPEHFLSAFGLRCNSKRLSEEFKDEPGCSSCRADRFDVVSVPLNYLTLEALKCWERVYGQLLQVEYPTGSGVRVSLNEIILDISQRVLNIFLKIATSDSEDNIPMFYEFYRADNGSGVGPSRTSWSSLIANIALNLSQKPTPAEHVAPSIPHAVGRIMPNNSVVQVFCRLLSGATKMEDFATDSIFDWNSDE